MKHFIFIFNAIFAVILAQGLVGCDDGHVDDPVHEGLNAEGYTVKITGTFQRLQTWSGSYLVAAACFGDESEYSVIQKALPNTSTDTSVETVTLSNVPANAKTVEIAVVSILRKRVASLYTYEIPEGQRHDDTIRVDVGCLDVGMFGAINQHVFQGSKTNCARCHGGVSPAAGLNLTAATAYVNLVGKAATTDASQTRVVAGSADRSYLYKVITEGDPHVGYPHPGLFVDEPEATFVKIVREWIDGGALK